MIEASPFPRNRNGELTLQIQKPIWTGRMDRRDRVVFSFQREQTPHDNSITRRGNKSYTSESVHLYYSENTTLRAFRVLNFVDWKSEREEMSAMTYIIGNEDLNIPFLGV